MDEQHQMLYDAVKHNEKLIADLTTLTYSKVDKCKDDRVQLRYYIYGMAIVMLILIGKPEWITALF